MGMQLEFFDYPTCRINKKIRLIEAFAGIGSQAMALRDIGADFEHHRVIEFDKYAMKAYNAIHDTNFEPTDICTVHGADLGITDKDKYSYVMTYSFPCQDLSVAGKQRGMTKGSGTRSGLLWEVERILKELPADQLPDILLMENVPQVHAEANKEDFDLWVEFLRSKGYVNHWQDLNARDYGVPQNRERCFMVSILFPNFVEYEFPEPIELKTMMKDRLERVVNEKYYINSDKSKELIEKLVNDGILKDIGVVYNKLKYVGNYRRDIDKEGYSGSVYKTDGLAPAMLARNYKEPVGVVVESRIVAMRERNPEKHTDRTTGLPTEQRLELAEDGIVNTLTTVQKDNLVLEKKPELQYRIRKLTERECWRLMDFPDSDFDKASEVESRTQLYKQAGNAIVRAVLMALFLQMNIQGIRNWNDRTEEEKVASIDNAGLY